MRTKKTPTKRQPRIKKTPTRKSPKNNLSNSAYRTPTKSSKTSHPGTPSTLSTHGSTVSSKSKKSNDTVKSIESAYKKVRVGNFKTPENEKDAEAFSVYDIDWTSKPSLVRALNFLLKEDDRRKLVGANHRDLVTAVLDSQNLSVCKQLCQVVALTVGKKEINEAMTEANQLGHKSKPTIVKKIMSYINQHNKRKAPAIPSLENEANHADNEGFIEFDMDTMDDKDGTKGKNYNYQDEESDEEDMLDNNNDDENEDEEEDDDDTGIEIEINDDDDDDDDDDDNNEDDDDDNEDDDDESDEKDYDEIVVKKENGISSANKPGKKQSKKKENMKFSEDDGSVDPFGSEVFSAANIKQAGVVDQGGTVLHISKPIKVIGETKQLFVCVIELGPSTFFFKGEFLQLPLLKVKKEREFFKNHIDWKMSWVPTIKNSDRRIPYSTQDALMKTNKNNTQSVIHFVVEHDIHASAPDIRDKIDAIVKAFKVCFKIYSKPGSIGRGTSFLEFLQGIGNQGLYGFFLRKYSDGVHPEPAADAITAVFDAAFNDPGLKLSWNISLDRFLPNFDIKQILVNHANVSGWNDLPDSDKEACFQNASMDMSRLPNWNAMVKVVQQYI